MPLYKMEVCQIRGVVAPGIVECIADDWDHMLHRMCEFSRANSHLIISGEWPDDGGDTIAVSYVDGYPTMCFGEAYREEP
jgi:hypothetical protein